MDIKKPKPRSSPNRAAKITSKRPASTANRVVRSGRLNEDVDAVLRSIDQETDSLNSDTREVKDRKINRRRRPWSRKRKIITWSVVGVFATLVLIAGLYGYRIANNTSGIFQGSMFGAVFSNDKLQADANGRSNILIFGTSEDDPDHSGAQLADSIMVLSVDQETKESYTVSIPRDLWVNYSTPCSLGSAGKINATYICALEATDNDQDKASLAFASKVGEVIGTDVQYFVAVNYNVVRGLVDSLGGVDVTIHSDDSRGIYDVATDLQISNGTHHVDGETALDLSRARNSKGGYGLSQSNFDREKNQQQVLKAIQDKALQSGTLTNPNKIVSLTDSLGKNIRTNVKSSELRTALDVASGIRTADMESKPLNDPDNPLVTTGNHAGQSIVRPAKGLTDYSDIHRYLAPN